MALINLSWVSTSVRAYDLADAQAQFRRGEYTDVLSAAKKQKLDGAPMEDGWVRLETETLLTVGNYPTAYEVIQKAAARDSRNVRFLLLARRAALFSGHEKEAVEYLARISGIISSGKLYARDADAFVALGEGALLLGVEPRIVLTNLFKRAQADTPLSRDAFAATGRLGLEKHDYQLASRNFQDAIKAFPDDPDFWSGLAEAFSQSDRKQMLDAIEKALALNGRHSRSRLLLAESLIDGEKYEDADQELARVLTVNPYESTALALQSVLALVRNDASAAEHARSQALSTWTHNPEVDYLIGRKLSQKYRFTEGAEAQRRSLMLDNNYTPAKIQLAQDLLRLGRDNDGWPLVAEAQKADAYDVTAFNLVTLRDKLAGFKAIENSHFRLRMAANEAPIYGSRAMALLERARDTLTAKYGLDLRELVTVEIYPSAGDFAVRTFGMPDNPGYLGVCFGPVITVNSPATQTANWESVLWHEFCHVVTLTMTRNRMPRWLSEGISVYEEGNENASWTRPMSLNYRERILSGKMQPISDMSAAFLKAKNSEDLQFAYYQSALVVQYLVEHYGLEKLKALLRALGTGQTMNGALAAQMGPLEVLDRGFAASARDQAQKLGRAYDLSKTTDVLSGLSIFPVKKGFAAKLQEVHELMEKKQWPEAKVQLLELTTKGPYLPGEDNTFALLAAVDRELGDRDGEGVAYTTMTEHESDALVAVGRLLALAQQAKNWPAVAKWSDAFVAINPLAPTPWRAWLEAEEKLGHPAVASAAGEVLLQLDPPDAPSVHYRVARQLKPTDVAGARRHVLAALEEAPRFRSAYDLLSQLPEASSSTPSSTSSSPRVSP